MMTQTQAQRLFEVSFEVCNKVGGIYTVVSSKAAFVKKLYSDYILIGPYFPLQAQMEFQPLPPPDHIRNAFQSLYGRGIGYYYGKWLIKGEPTVILIDFKGAFNSVNEYKKIFWEKFGVDSLNAGFDYDEPLAFSIAAGELIEKLHKQEPYKKSVCHAHEWMTGFTALYLKSKQLPIGTVFTTHATMLGRSLSGSGDSLYDEIASIDPMQKAREQNVLPKHTAEHACAKYSDCFTTVSELLAEEAEHLLKKKSDVILVNGLDGEQFPPFEDLSLLHAQNRDRLREFCMYYFFPYYQFDLEHTLFFFTGGRQEVRNKGIDITVAALAKLNEKLKQEGSNRTIVTFFWVPGEQFGAHADLLESKMHFRHIKNYLYRNDEKVHKAIVSSIFSEKGFSEEKVFDEEFHHNVRKLRSSFYRQGNPPLSAFYVHDNHPIMELFYRHGLMNSASDKVKVVLYPIYMNGVDGLLDFNYYEAASACHLGLFPSWYEPWGYTPAESITLGVPAVTSNLAGFGKFILNKDKDSEGVYVLMRRNKEYAKLIDDYAWLLQSYAKLDRTKRIDQKINAKRVSMLTDWAQLIENYVQAHNIAIGKASK